MYDNGLENLKKAALSVKVRSFLNGSGELDPADLENPELSLDLQSLIDDPNFEVGDGLFPELLHEKHVQALSKGLLPLEYSQQLRHNNNNNNTHSSQQQQQQQQHNNSNQHHLVHSSSNGGPFAARNPLAYMPQPVHGGSSFSNNNNGGNNNSNNVNSTTTSGGNNNNDVLVKEEPLDHHRMDFNGNAVSSSEQSSYGSSYSNPLSNVTSPSSSSSQGYSPNAYAHPHHLTPTTLPHGTEGGGLVVTKSGGLNFSSKGLHSHSHHHSHGHGHSKKLKNVDKASDEYKRRRERNNIAVRKSREKAKIRSRETEERVKVLCRENDRLQKKIELLTEELTFLRSFFSNVGGLPEQIHREFNKHLETFQHHHVQNGIQ
jgi:CCAAT/enhancer binding protein (C/EBP)